MLTLHKKAEDYAQENFPIDSEGNGQTVRHDIAFHSFCAGYNEAIEYIKALEKIQTAYRKKYISKEMKGYNKAYRKALRVLDEMFRIHSPICASDWFEKSPNLFQGREEFIKEMIE